MEDEENRKQKEEEEEEQNNPMKVWLLWRFWLNEFKKGGSNKTRHLNPEEWLESNFPYSITAESNSMAMRVRKMMAV